MRVSRSFLWSLSTVILAALVAYTAARWAVRDRPQAQQSEQSFHAWLHANLNITAEQERKLFPIERAFETKRRAQRETIKAASRSLAEVIREQQEPSPSIAAAHQSLLEAQGELQRLTLEHFFAMKEHLTPAQGEKLLQWTHDSIFNESGHRDF